MCMLLKTVEAAVPSDGAGAAALELDILSLLWTESFPKKIMTKSSLQVLMNGTLHGNGVIADVVKPG